MTRKEKFANILELLNFANDDLTKLQSFLDTERINDQFYRRLFLRNIFSVIETYIHITKEIIKFKILVDSVNNCDLTWSEIVILNEKKVSVDNKGKVKTTDEYQNFEQSLRFTFNTFAKIFNSKLPNYSDNKYRILIRLSQRRNDITHPKSLENMIVTDQELKDTVLALEWFLIENSIFRNESSRWLGNAL